MQARAGKNAASSDQPAFGFIYKFYEFSLCKILFLQIFALANFRSCVSCTSCALDKFTLPRGFSLSILCRATSPFSIPHSIHLSRPEIFARCVSCDIVAPYLARLFMPSAALWLRIATKRRRNYTTKFNRSLCGAYTRFCRIMYGCRNRERRAETTHYGVKILKFNAAHCNLGLRFVLRAQRADFMPLNFKYMPRARDFII